MHKEAGQIASVSASPADVSDWVVKMVYPAGRNVFFHRAGNYRFFFFGSYFVVGKKIVKSNNLRPLWPDEWSRSSKAREVFDEINNETKRRQNYHNFKRFRFHLFSRDWRDKRL